VPGLAKTLLISHARQGAVLQFSRIQFTPDLMPATSPAPRSSGGPRDGAPELQFPEGPDLRQRHPGRRDQPRPPKTQSALLEAMQERQVTVGGRDARSCPKPFFVLATQNPIEQEGTYPLPEAQLDRFMFMIKVDYPTLEEEREILRRTTEGHSVELQPVLSSQEILDLQSIVRRVPIADQVLDYAMRLARFTRLNNPNAPAFIKEQATSSRPRRPAGRFHVSADDVKSIAHPDDICNFSAEAEGISSAVSSRRSTRTPAPRSRTASSPAC
jgi:MoxR-like ATPase